MKYWCRLAPSTQLRGVLALSTRGTRCVRQLSTKFKPLIDARSRDRIQRARGHHGGHGDIDIVWGIDVRVGHANTIDEYLSLSPRSADIDGHKEVDWAPGIVEV